MSAMAIASQLWMMMFFQGGLTMPVSVPPLPEDPLLSAIAPADAIYYQYWAGMDLPQADSENAAERLLAEEEVQEFFAYANEKLQELAAQYSGPDNDNPESRFLAIAGPSLLKVFYTRPVAAFVNHIDIEKEEFSGGIIANLGDEREAAIAVLQQLEDHIFSDQQFEVKVDEVIISGNSFQQFQIPDGPKVTFGVMGKYFLLTVGDGVVEGIFRRAKTPAPEWLTELKKVDAGRRTGLAYFNPEHLIAKTLVEMEEADRKLLTSFGLADLKTFNSVSGLKDGVLISHLRVDVVDQPTGLIKSLLDASPLTKEDLSSIPANSDMALVARMDAAQIFEGIQTLMSAANPRNAHELEENLKMMKAETGVDLEKDLLPHVDSNWAIYADADNGSLIGGWIARVGVKNHAELSKSYLALLKYAEKNYTEDEWGPTLHHMEFAGEKIHFISTPYSPFTVSMCLTEDSFYLTLNPQAIKGQLRKQVAPFKTLADQQTVKSLLSEDKELLMVQQFYPEKAMTLMYSMGLGMAVFGSHELEEEGVRLDLSKIPSLASLHSYIRQETTSIAYAEDGDLHLVQHRVIPGDSMATAAPVAIALLLPAIQSARAAARRVGMANQLKQIGLAMHIHHEQYRSFPAAYNTDKDGKPLLSWRVHILPYIEQQNLYDQFHLDEPWDSEHNKKLIEQMPVIYQTPREYIPPGKTNMVSIVGKNTAIRIPAADQAGKERPAGTSMADIRDGSSNTLMVVECDPEHAVIWTKPDDISVDVKKLADMMNKSDNTFSVSFADGSVHFISEDVDSDTLRKLSTIADGEVVEIP